MSRRSKYDWDSISRDYRTGQFTVRELAAKHGPHFSLIAKMMKKFGVTPDLSAEVRKATNASLMRAVVLDRLESGVATDAVLAAAEANRLVIEAHRTQLLVLRAVVAGMAAELAAETGMQLPPGKSVAEVAQAANLTADEVACLLGAPTLVKRAQIAERLATTLARLIPLERQSRNLDTSRESDASFESVLDRVLVGAAE
jgi:hypothetical protein